MNKNTLKSRAKMMFDVASKIDDVDEWVDYFWKNLYVGLEYELENSGDFEGRLSRNFGVNQTAYHEYGDCDNCEFRGRCTERGNNNVLGCHTFFRKNLVVSIQEDGSITGSEFLLHTGTMSTQQFIKRLPIRKFKDLGYHAGSNGSIHVHLIVPYFKRDIPNVILENFYNLFRYYYCGLAYLTGATRRTCLRGHVFSQFSDYHRTFKEAREHRLRQGINLNNMQWKDSYKFITELDVEIRTYDNSLNVNHVSLVRFLSRLLWIRATEISEYGKYILRDTIEWKAKKKVIQSLNRHNKLGGFDSYTTETHKREALKTVKLMKETSEELYVELQHLMTETEKHIFKEFIEKPIWLNRDEKLENMTKKAKDSISEFDRALLCIVKTKSIFAGSRKQYYKKTAKALDSTTDNVRVRLSKIKARWNKEIGAYTLGKR